MNVCACACVCVCPTGILFVRSVDRMISLCRKPKTPNGTKPFIRSTVVAPPCLLLLRPTPFVNRGVFMEANGRRGFYWEARLLRAHHQAAAGPPQTTTETNPPYKRPHGVWSWRQQKAGLLTLISTSRLLRGRGNGIQPWKSSEAPDEDLVCRYLSLLGVQPSLRRDLLGSTWGTHVDSMVMDEQCYWGTRRKQWHVHPSSISDVQVTVGSHCCSALLLLPLSFIHLSINPSIHPYIVWNRGTTDYRM